MSVLEFFTAAQAYASAAAEAEHHAPSINDIWFPLANFLIYAFIIVKFAFPLIRDFLKSRHDEVVSTISQAAAKKQAAEALVNEYRAKLSGLDKRSSVDSCVAARGGRTRKKTTCRRGSGDWRSKFKKTPIFSPSRK